MQSRRTITQDFKRDAARLARERGNTSAVARDLGIHESLLSKWKQRLQAAPQRPFPGQGNPQDREPAASYRPQPVSLSFDGWRRATGGGDRVSFQPDEAGDGMNRREFLGSVGAMTVGAMEALQGEAAMAADNAQMGTEVLAYYFPQYHPDARNEKWHGKGWTEWELMKAAKPRYPGHRQPIVPQWGYFDESDPAWAAKEIALAADHGITGFLYDWYWYEDGPFLQDGLERGFLKAPNNTRLKFGLMWANHDWLNIHPATYVNRPETLASGKVSRAAFERIQNHIIPNYFACPNYLKFGGAPYFSIYELGTFILSMGGLDGAKAALEDFRQRTKAAGHRGLHLNAVVWGVTVLPSEIKVNDVTQVVRDLGLDSVTSYVWVHHYDPNTDGFPKGSYAKAAERNVALWDEYRHKFGVPYHPNVTMGWDPSPRTISSDVYDARGYPWTAALQGNTPAAFQEALKRAKAWLDKAEPSARVVTLNAWNEWTEGSYLLPDTVVGTAYLEAIRDVFGAAR